MYQPWRISSRPASRPLTSWPAIALPAPGGLPTFPPERTGSPERAAAASFRGQLGIAPQLLLNKRAHSCITMPPRRLRTTAAFRGAAGVHPQPVHGTPRRKYRPAAPPSSNRGSTGRAPSSRGPGNRSPSPFLPVLSLFLPLKQPYACRGRTRPGWKRCRLARLAAVVID